MKSAWSVKVVMGRMEECVVSSKGSGMWKLEEMGQRNEYLKGTTLCPVVEGNVVVG